ncbi:MAG: sugar phosphate isomerase/epimerase [Candidatus Aminicenantes bacterium]|nr:sugar phosphate isomerase/epimerase [Candidatus Aminicenantes bacterium]
MFEDLFVRVPFEGLERQAASLADAGAGPEVYIRAERLREFTPRTLAATRRILGRFRAHSVHAPFMDVWPGVADDDVRRLSLEKMKRVMEIAAELGSLLVVMHFNYDPLYYRQQFPQWLERAAAFYAALLADDDGPLIALENIAEPTPHIAMQLQRKVGRPRLVHCFDFGHHHVFARIPFSEWLYYLDPRGHVHFHLHDNCGASDDHLALGRGTIDWPAVRTAIAGLSCPFSVALEPHAAADIRASVAYYRKHFLAPRRRL